MISNEFAGDYSYPAKPPPSDGPDSSGHALGAAEPAAVEKYELYHLVLLLGFISVSKIIRFSLYRLRLRRQIARFSLLHGIHRPPFSWPRFLPCGRNDGERAKTELRRVGDSMQAHLH